MLDLEKVDLADLCMALEDHSDEREWWLDPTSAQMEMWSPYLRESDDEHPGDREFLRVEPTPSHEGYDDMAQFAARVCDPRARELLQRALAGRGAFRRFKDTLFEFPELRAAWFAFHDARVERRALRWLADHGLVDTAVAERAIEVRPDPSPPQLGGVVDAEAIARGVAADLAELYGERLQEVLLFGSRARGDAHSESDLDLLVVLGDPVNPWDELRRMSELVWSHSMESGVLVSALPVAETDLEAGLLPVVARARAEGVPVG